MRCPSATSSRPTIGSGSAAAGGHGTSMRWADAALEPVGRAPHRPDARGPGARGRPRRSLLPGHVGLEPRHRRALGPCRLRPRRWSPGRAALLARFQRWSPTVDRFTPIQGRGDLDVPVPDPSDPGRDLSTPSGQRVTYRDRSRWSSCDDDDERVWLGAHRVVDDFADPGRAGARRAAADSPAGPGSTSSSRLRSPASTDGVPARWRAPPYRRAPRHDGEAASRPPPRPAPCWTMVRPRRQSIRSRHGATVGDARSGDRARHEPGRGP